MKEANFVLVVVGVMIGFTVGGFIAGGDVDKLERDLSACYSQLR